MGIERRPSFAEEAAMNRLKSTMVLIALAALAAPGAALAGKVYKWVDENGVTHYGDAIPPEYSKKTHDVLNEQGSRVETVNEDKPETAGPGAVPQDNRDRALLATYGSVAEIEQVRDRRTGYLDSQNQVSLDRLAALKSRLAELETGGGDQNELATVRQRISEYDAEIARRNEEKARIAASFDADIARFRELKGLPAQ
jgi:hypothetical protein